MRPTPAFDAVDHLHVVAWFDEVVDTHGLHPCSSYVETFWLSVLGPSTTWLLRHLATRLDADPDGYDLDLTETAARLGLGHNQGRHSAFMRALGRLVQFEMARQTGPGELAVRRSVPPLARRHVVRLSPVLQQAHARWMQNRGSSPAVEAMRRQTRQLALSYLETGLDFEEAERQLQRLGFHPALCYEAASWALARHESALHAARSPASSTAGDAA